METENILSATDTADTESEVETGEQHSQIDFKLNENKIIILSDEVVVRPNSPAIKLPTKLNIVKIRKVSAKKANISKIVKPATIPKNSLKKIKPRLPDKTRKSVLEKTSTLTTQLIKTQFATITSDEFEARNSVDELGVGLSQPTSSQKIQQACDTHFATSSLSNSQITVPLEKIVTISKVQEIPSNNSMPTQSTQQLRNTHTKTVSDFNESNDKSQELVLAKIDGLQRHMSKGFARLAKLGDNNYNDIREMIPTHSVVEFNLLDGRLREYGDLYNKMKRYLQRYRSVATTNDIYGSVLSRIVDDKVLLEFNFKGVKGKLKFEDYAVVEMLFGKHAFIRA